MEGKLYTGEDYRKEIDSQDYLKTYCTFDSGTVAENEILTFNLKNLFETFSSAGARGDVLINTGPGPTIYQLLSACEAFQEIIASDHSEQNPQELKKWLKKEPGAYDLSPAMQYVCELEGDRSKWQEKEARLRRTVTRLLKRDASQPHPLGPAQVPPVDCVLTLLALECACHDVDAYRAAGQGLVSLPKPGGHLVTVAVALRTQHYMVGAKKFFGLHLEKEPVEKALQEAGCQVLRCQYSPASYSEAHCINEGICFVVARKGPGAWQRGPAPEGNYHAGLPERPASSHLHVLTPETRSLSSSPGPSSEQLPTRCPAHSSDREKG
ncbi:LOW QUALITY PROTEIN: indolethylamine N-methyltransferase [Mesoplodon densirostris]|uniref:LOW QUALITY PROTEIN: indolethylamine N-methyltransferase n=1 Tax=Mesoplodon densirostris TaxID=48708 RepID=UPI0028DC232F|nr:LOW QUALITY PROTEIN: indolethylamine N-methyltransferase [Mesoplodon densirostris]